MQKPLGRYKIAFGIAKIRPDERSSLLQRGLDAWRGRFAGRIFAFTEQAALVYGDLMGAAHRAGTALSAPDGMIAAIAIVNQGRVASRNTRERGVGSSVVVERGVGSSVVALARLNLPPFDDATNPGPTCGALAWGSDSTTHAPQCGVSSSRRRRLGLHA
ncbi:MAG: hypothetical protein NW204_05445 [Xanthomonadaceae bacterium]|nr:hypothetical protein [Xanthomonadaceae bacterium]